MHVRYFIGNQIFLFRKKTLLHKIGSSGFINKHEERVYEKSYKLSKGIKMSHFNLNALYKISTKC
jgi:hypothetical protein